MVLQFEFAGFNLREIQYVIDDGEQRIGAAARGFDVFALFIRQVGLQQEGSHADDPVHRRADLMAHVRQKFRLRQRGLLQFLVQRNELGVALDELLLAFSQGLVRRVALGLVDVGAGMVAQARNQFDFVRQLDKIIIRTDGERLPLDRRIFVRGKDDDGRITGARIRAELSHERQTIDTRHDEVLQNDRGLDLVRDLDGFARIRTIMQVDVRLIGERAP